MKCRVCGCTDLQACTWFEIRGDGSKVRRACWWVAPEICSACVDQVDAPEPEPEPLLFDAGGRPLVMR